MTKTDADWIKQEMLESAGTVKQRAQSPVTQSPKSSPRVSTSSPARCVNSCSCPHSRETPASVPVSQLVIHIYDAIEML